MPRLAFLFIFLFWIQPAVGVEIPRGLSKQDRSAVIRTLGMNSSSKLLANPYPLGGYSGLELGISFELIDIATLSRLGCDPGASGCTNTERSDKKEWSYSRFTLGKGLYNDIDLFMSMALPTPGVGLSDFGGQLRWNFYEAQFLPITLSTLLHANQMNLKNTYSNQNTGVSLIAAVTVDDVAIYFGGGFIKSESQFTCGNTGDAVVDISEPECATSNSGYVSQTEHGRHSLVGLSVKFNRLFIAAQIDRYRDPVFSGKLGFRF